MPKIQNLNQKREALDGLANALCQLTPKALQGGAALARLAGLAADDVRPAIRRHNALVSRLRAEPDAVDALNELLLLCTPAVAEHLARFFERLAALGPRIRPDQVLEQVVWQATGAAEGRLVESLSKELESCHAAAEQRDAEIDRLRVEIEGTKAAAKEPDDAPQE